MVKTSSGLKPKMQTPTAVSTVIPLPEKSSAVILQKALDLQKIGKLADAVAAYDDVLRIAPTKLAALVNKGVALRRLGQHEAAMACFWRALAISPENVEAWHNAGNTLLDLKRYDEAQAALKTAIEKAPQMAEIWLAVARLFIARRQFSTAEAALGRASALRPDDHMARKELAGLYLEQGKAAEACAEYQRLQSVFPNDASVRCGTGQALISLRKMEEALPHLQRSIDLAHDHLDAHLGLARWHLLSGDFDKGWDEYEWRRHRTDKKQPKVNGIEWDGSNPTGKTILVYAEQGFGDTIQFLRYLPILASRGADIIVVCQKSLLSLVEKIDGVKQATCVWRPLPVFDFYTPLLSLPHKMGLGKESVPSQTQYLKSHKTAHFPKPPLGTKLKVGLVWAGSPTHPDDRNRSVGLDGLMPLAGVPGVRLYSLQAGPRAKDIAKIAHPALIVDFSKHLNDFADTAAVIEQLDLVVTVDSAVAHLAGALGKPVWVLIPPVTDWRWQLNRSDSPWYPTMKLFRRGITDDWRGPVADMVRALHELAASMRGPDHIPETVSALSVFPKPDGQARYGMSAPRRFLDDAGVGFLMRRERSGIGYEYATRALLDAHMQSGDLFIDIGAHWGVMTLHAVTSTDDIRALAFEPAPHNLEHLKRWLAENDIAERVEVFGAAVSDRCGQGALKPESTMGHSLIRDDQGAVPVVTIDAVLSQRPELSERRVIVKIDVEGQEPEVIAGMDALLRSGRVAMIIWERGVEYNKPGGREKVEALRAVLSAYGFTAWRFESEDDAGPLVPFVEDGRTGNVIELAPRIEPYASYGIPRPAQVEQPADLVFDVCERARALFHEGTRAYTARQQAKASDLYAEAAALDGGIRDLYNNLGVMMREAGKPAAKIACYRRAHAMSPDNTGIASNLANALREEGDLGESASLHKRILARAPHNATFLYNAGLVDRDDGRPEDAVHLLDRALAIDPKNKDCHWDRALVLLQSGDYARGFPAYESRWGIDRAYKRNVPLPRWDGSPLNGRSIFLHDEQGFGDVLQFSRFIPALKSRYGAGKVVLECQPELMRLMTYAPGVDAVIPRERAIPQCDVYCPLLSLPGLFGTTLDTLPREVPYLFAPDMAPDTAAAFPADNRLKVGIVWAGQLIPRDRSCPLEKILPILDDPRIAPISLQVGGRSDDLKAMGADMFITDMSPYLRDFAETAAVMNALDLMLTIDTSVAHLAGALGVPTFLLLRTVSDWRWLDRIETSPWYPSMRLFRQSDPRRWDEPVAAVKTALRAFADERADTGI